MKILTLCIILCMSILLSCSGLSDKSKSEKTKSEVQTEDEEYSAPSSSPGPYPAGASSQDTVVASR